MPINGASRLWYYTGKVRPPFAQTPGAGQESVWDYPRPPRLEKSSKTIQVMFQDRTLARSSRSIRVLETASPPTVYLPVADVDFDCLEPCDGESWCEWKGRAHYLRLASPVGSDKAVAWFYPDPNIEYAAIANYVAFYPGRVACWVDAERVAPQAGEFYGGWMTREIVGPVKGEPGTQSW
ncbi:MAG: DUF427 domain-containing protein [Proteobacteria bacterium]|nr:DUF427 domain-containing protein [Pseudomonadota bacterium]